MLDSSSTTERTAKKICGSFTRCAEENFRPELFGDVCRLIWPPPKTDAAVAAIVGKTDRAARDYLNGKVPAPGVLLAAVLVEITKRD